jgi:hypothetical protein
MGALFVIDGFFCPQDEVKKKSTKIVLVAFDYDLRKVPLIERKTPELGASKNPATHLVEIVRAGG